MHRHCSSPLPSPPTPQNKGTCLKNIQNTVIHLQAVCLHFRVPHTELRASHSTNTTWSIDRKKVELVVANIIIKWAWLARIFYTSCLQPCLHFSFLLNSSENTSNIETHFGTYAEISHLKFLSLASDEIPANISRATQCCFFSVTQRQRILIYSFSDDSVPSSLFANSILPKLFVFLWIPFHSSASLGFEAAHMEIQLSTSCVCSSTLPLSRTYTHKPVVLANILMGEGGVQEQVVKKEQIWLLIFPVCFVLIN